MTKCRMPVKIPVDKARQRLERAAIAYRRAWLKEGNTAKTTPLVYAALGYGDVVAAQAAQQKKKKRRTA